jgi:hypothetical protein
MLRHIYRWVNTKPIYPDEFMIHPHGSSAKYTQIGTTTKRPQKSRANDFFICFWPKIDMGCTQKKQKVTKNPNLSLELKIN